MQTIYIVTWLLANLVSDPCPDRNRTDEFGRDSNTFCAVLHAHYEYENHTRSFFVRDSAFAFYERAKNEYDLSEVEIDSLELTPVEIDSLLLWR